MSRDVFDSLATPVDVTRRGEPALKQGQLSSQQASAFGYPLRGHSRSMQLVDGPPTCSYDRGCEHDHGHDPFGAEFAAHATMHDWQNNGWTTQQIVTEPVEPLPGRCIYCQFSGRLESHNCGTVKYLKMPTSTL